MRVRIASLIFALAVAAPARCAEAPPFDPDSLDGEPGVQRSEIKDGSKVVTTWTKNGVSITRTVDGPATDVWANDNTGKGAVFCAWMIDVSVRATLETCPDPEFDGLRADLDKGISDIDDFIVANSIQPEDMGRLQAREASQYARARGRPLAVPSHPQNVCKEGDTGAMVAYFDNMTHEQRQKAFADLLSQPRWPVTNPCL